MLLVSQSLTNHAVRCHFSVAVRDRQRAAPINHFSRAPVEGRRAEPAADKAPTCSSCRNNLFGKHSWRRVDITSKVRVERDAAEVGPLPLWAAVMRRTGQGPSDQRCLVAGRLSRVTESRVPERPWQNYYAFPRQLSNTYRTFVSLSGRFTPLVAERQRHMQK